MNLIVLLDTENFRRSTFFAKLQALNLDCYSTEKFAILLQNDVH